MQELNQRSSAKLVFVFGPARSGTTWLGELLRASGAVKYVFEPDVADRHESPWRQEVAKLFCNAPWGDYKNEELRAGYEAFAKHLAYLFGRAEPRDRTTCVAKIPRLEHVEGIRHFLGPHRIILLRRHPLGILNSWVKYRRFHREENVVYLRKWVGRLAEVEGRADVQRLADEGRPEHVLVVGLALAYRRLDRVCTGREILTITYENLCRHPVVTCEAVYSVCGLQMNEKVKALVESFSHPERPQKSFHSFKQYSDQRRSAWRRELAPWRIRAAHAALEKYNLRNLNMPGDDGGKVSTAESVRGALTEAGRQGACVLLKLRTWARKWMWPNKLCPSGKTNGSQEKKEDR